MAKAKFELIPCIYAGNLPQNVGEEMRAWQDDLCYHGDGGCVFHVQGDDVAKLPLFLAWLVEIGACKEEDTRLVSTTQFLAGRPDLKGYPDGWYQEYQTWRGDRPETITLAMTGT